MAWLFMRVLVTWSQRPPRATRGGRESGAGAPAVRAAARGGACWESQLGELRRVSSESRAGGPTDRKSDESGEQTTPEELAYGSTWKSVQRRGT